MGAAGAGWAGRGRGKKWESLPSEKRGTPMTGSLAVLGLSRGRRHRDSLSGWPAICSTDDHSPHFSRSGFFPFLYRIFIIVISIGSISMICMSILPRLPL